jgi:pyoverdine/dityrosine biosynthesis protein Dit1
MAIEITEVQDSATTVYTSTGNSAVTFASFCNTSGSAETLDVYVVPDTDTADNTNIVIKQLTVNSTDTHQLYLGGEKILLEDGDTIQATSGTAGSFTAVVSYTSI